MCAVPALTPAARTARAAPAFFGLQTLFDLLRPARVATTPPSTSSSMLEFVSPMRCAVRLRAPRGSRGVPALERVWAFEPLAFCASPVPGTLSPLSPPSRSVATARVHASFLSHTEHISARCRRSISFMASPLVNTPWTHRSSPPPPPPHSLTSLQSASPLFLFLSRRLLSPRCRLRVLHTSPSDSARPSKQLEDGCERCIGA